MNLIMLGAPGAGKGTQAQILNDRYQIPTISTGAIIREAIKLQTPTGVMAKGYIEKGALVPDEVVIGIIKERLSKSDCKNGFILDGFPRTIAQAEALEQLGVKIDKVIDIEVSDDLIVSRLSGRRECSKCASTYHIVNNPTQKEGICDRCGGELITRKDDAPDTILSRLEVYHAQTEPLIDFYRKKEILCEVEGVGELDTITQAIVKVLEN